MGSDRTGCTRGPRTPALKSHVETAIRTLSRTTKKHLGTAKSATIALAASLVLSACSSDITPASEQSGASGGTAGQKAGVLDQPITHIHGVARDPITQSVVMATHEGAFERRDGGWYGRGDVVDLMGFAIAPDGTWFASGHPGFDTDLPQPVGLIASTDRGQTWQTLSRGGESDFHVLAVGPAGVLGFDGTLRASADGTRWDEASIPAPPVDLAVNRATGAVLATTEQGLLQSTDDLATWAPLDPPESVVLVDWVDEETIVATTAANRVLLSHDAGQSWEAGSPLSVEVQALGAHLLPSGKTEILVATQNGLLKSLDFGSTFVQVP